VALFLIISAFSTLDELHVLLMHSTNSIWYWLWQSHWCHLAIKLKPHHEQANCHISTSEMAIVNMLHGYSRQHHAIGTFSVQ